jgi:hypothetical protein
MEYLSKEYGWTPEQIKEQSYEDIACYLKISAVKNKLSEAENKKYGRAKRT